MLHPEVTSMKKLRLEKETLRRMVQAKAQAPDESLRCDEEVHLQRHSENTHCAVTCVLECAQ